MRIGFILKGLAGYFAHVKPFLEYSNNHEYFVFHLNKYYGKTQLDREITDNVIFIELSDRFKLDTILKKLNLNYMVSFNPGNLFDQAIILTCKRIGVKTVYFQHGVSPNYEKIGIKRKSHILWTNYALILKKYLYFYSLILLEVVKSKQVEYYKYLLFRTYSLIQKDSHSFTRNYGTPSVHADLNFVYNQNDKAILVNHLQVQDNEVEILGYPFIESTNNQPVSDKKYVLYLSSALRASKVINIDLDEELLFYKSLVEVISTTNYILVIKLHPLDDYKEITKCLSNFREVIVLTDYNLADLVSNAEIVIGDLSSALFYAVRYYKRIIIMTYPYLKDYAFDLTDWEIGIKSDLKNLQDTLEMPNLSESFDRSAYNNFLEDFLQYKSHSAYDIFFNRLLKVDD